MHCKEQGIPNNENQSLAVSIRYYYLETDRPPVTCARVDTFPAYILYMKPAENMREIPVIAMHRYFRL